MQTLGRDYVVMAVAAFLAIVVDQSLIAGAAAWGRIALAGALGAALGLIALKILDRARRSASPPQRF